MWNVSQQALFWKKINTKSKYTEQSVKYVFPKIFNHQWVINVHIINGLTLAENRHTGVYTHTPPNTWSKLTPAEIITVCRHTHTTCYLQKQSHM